MGEQVIIGLKNEFPMFKKDISTRYSIEQSDVDELIIYYIDGDNRRKYISDQPLYQEAIEYAKFTKQNLPVFLEVSEKSKLFQREMENSKVIPLQINEKEKLKNEILEKEKLLKDMLDEERLAREKMKQKKLEEENRLKAKKRRKNPKRKKGD